MTWRKWQVLEALLGVALFIDILPLSNARFWTAVGLVGLFSVCFFNRVLKQMTER